MRTRVFAFISILIGSLLPLLLLEIALQFLPVCKGPELAPVDSNNPVRHFVPGHEFTWSKGWLFEIVNSGRVNTSGFINDHDYTSESDKPLLAVIGDSYVEAIMVPFGESISGRLALAAGGNSRVYSFANSGSALTNYLDYASYARRNFHPSGMVVVIVGNDFDASLVEYRQKPGFHYFRETSDGKLEPLLLDYTGKRSVIRSLARNSALARHIMRNSGNLGQLLLSIFEPGRHKYVGNTQAFYDDRRLTLSKMVIDRFIDELPTKAGLDPADITLVLDGIRPELYADQVGPTAPGSYFEEMRNYLAGKSGQGGFELIDMQPLFSAHYARHGQRFEYDIDNHWNSLGHEIATKAVTDGKMFTRNFLTGNGDRTRPTVAK